MASYNIAPSIARTVSTLTVLLGWTRLRDYDDLIASLSNLDGSNDVFLISEFSEDGASPDMNAVTTRITPGKSGVFEVKNNRRTFYRFSAQTTSPGFPTVNTTWSLVGHKTNNQR